MPRSFEDDVDYWPNCGDCEPWDENSSPNRAPWQTKFDRGMRKRTERRSRSRSPIGRFEMEAPSTSQRSRPSQQLPSAVLTSLREAALPLVEDKIVDLGNFGALLSRYDARGSEYTEFIMERLRACRPNVSEVKRLQESLCNLPVSSDNIVRRLVEIIGEQTNVIIGLCSVVDSVVLNFEALSSKMQRTAAQITKVADAKLPVETNLHESNLTRSWNIRSAPPFKAFNLNKLMRKWRIPGRCRPTDHVSHCVDFLHHYLVEACEPATAVQEYACRVSGGCAKDTSLKDIPEDIVDVLTGCCLDGLLMGAPELCMTAEELSENPTEYWTALGPNNSARRDILQARKEDRAIWIERIRQALGRALLVILLSAKHINYFATIFMYTSRHSTWRKF
ncbi:hypothetical protein OESDEN_12952 [Oesophagostomum dentatum]|uniref:Uncharacterized protein n=1 Tax=Oesophagostomum dentatum TaxID=61180 RepID=A0A0B1SUR8_OESDE|nr:hypothetical protein OESDEN_12952 [Oesophagostomum dentatum]